MRIDSRDVQEGASRAVEKSGPAYSVEKGARDAVAACGAGASVTEGAELAMSTFLRLNYPDVLQSLERTIYRWLDDNKDDVLHAMRKGEE